VVLMNDRCRQVVKRKVFDISLKLNLWRLKKNKTKKKKLPG